MVGLAVLVLVASTDTHWLAGEELHVATGGGIRATVFTIAGRIVAMLLVTLALRIGMARRRPSRYRPTPTGHDRGY